MLQYISLNREKIPANLRKKEPSQFYSKKEPSTYYHSKVEPFKILFQKGTYCNIALKMFFFANGI